jgi:hypothetical protein
LKKKKKSPLPLSPLFSKRPLIPNLLSCSSSLMPDLLSRKLLQEKYQSPN